MITSTATRISSDPFSVDELKNTLPCPFGKWYTVSAYRNGKKQKH